jgi:multiple sugar transport system substrate-binding protein
MNRHLTKAAAAAVGLLLATTTAACGNGDDGKTTSDGKTILTVALWNYASTPEFKALIEGFEADNPTIDVQPVDILADDYPDKITTMLAGGEQTDVLTMKNVISYARYATRGQLASLTEEVKGVDQKSYLGLDAFNIKDEYFAMPYRQDFWALYYNKALLKDSGVDMSNLTWDDYAKLAKSTTKGTGTNKVYGTYLHTWRSVVQAIAAAQTGGDQLGANYAFMANQYKMTLDLEKSGATLPYATASSQKVGYDSMFSPEKAAMVPMGTWYAAKLIADKAAGKTKVDWGIAPMPQVAKDGKITTFGSPTAFAVNKKAKNPDAARKFVLWASGEKGATAIAKIGVYPSFTNDAVLSAYSSVAGMPTDEVAKKAFKPDTIVLEMPVSEKSSDVDAILNEEHQLIMVGDKTVDAGIAEMNSRVKSEVS